MEPIDLTGYMKIENRRNCSENSIFAQNIKKSIVLNLYCIHMIDVIAKFNRVNKGITVYIVSINDK